MKSLIRVLALGAALCAAPAVHAQTYIDQPFGSTPTSNTTITWALGSWSVGSGTLNSAIPAQNNTTLAASVALESTAITAGLTNIQFTYIGTDVGSGGNTNATFNFSIGTRLENSTGAYTYTAQTGFPWAIPATQSTLRFDSNITFQAGLDYSLLFESTDLRTGDSLSIDNLLVRRVPGPLPILGALAAFGWSRKLRQKIRDAAAIDAPAAVVA